MSNVKKIAAVAAAVSTPDHLKLLHLDPATIVVDPNYNFRAFEPELLVDHEELLNSIRVMGVTTPIQVRQEGGVGPYIVVRGHLRLAAKLRCIAEGNDAGQPLIPALLDTRETTALQRDLDLIVSNSGIAPTAQQRSKIIGRLMAHGLNNTEIANQMGYSVNYLLKTIELGDAPRSVHDMIANKEVAQTTVMEAIQGIGPRKVEQVLIDALALAKSEGKKALTGDHVARINPLAAPKSAERIATAKRKADEKAAADAKAIADAEAKAKGEPATTPETAQGEPATTPETAQGEPATTPEPAPAVKNGTGARPPVGKSERTTINLKGAPDGFISREEVAKWCDHIAASNNIGDALARTIRLRDLMVPKKA